MSALADNVWMLRTVAAALGEDLLKDLAFVGGATTSLFLDDDLAKEHVRHTKDVDVIVNIIGRAGWYQLQEKLRKCGFSECIDADAPVCAMKLKTEKLRVDFMPDDEGILGFSNRWYRPALRDAAWRCLPGEPEQKIRLISPQYFVATKLEAWLGRGNNDPLGSTDVEDLLILFDGRSTIFDELNSAGLEMQGFLAMELHKLLNNPGFDLVVRGCTQDSGRAELMFENIERFVQFHQECQQGAAPKAEVER
ncbi:hypothetical protein V8J88_00935 [Massilia sp. W12]|uniref:hypothetical protein n=1 Tax=Massilia sp. W12 TaxID=3126507 RepID=UPI0030D353B9